MKLTMRHSAQGGWGWGCDARYPALSDAFSPTSVNKVNSDAGFYQLLGQCQRYAVYVTTRSTTLCTPTTTKTHALRQHRVCSAA